VTGHRALDLRLVGYLTGRHMIGRIGVRWKLSPQAVCLCVCVPVNIFVACYLTFVAFVCSLHLMSVRCQLHESCLQFGSAGEFAVVMPESFRCILLDVRCLCLFVAYDVCSL
jgi:hypothetical protein